MTDRTAGFTAWIEKHYELVDDPEKGPEFHCRRCGMQVSYMTKHARVRHGDDVEILPIGNFQSDRDWSY